MIRRSADRLSVPFDDLLSVCYLEGERAILRFKTGYGTEWKTWVIYNVRRHGLTYLKRRYARELKYVNDRYGDTSVLDRPYEPEEYSDEYEYVEKLICQKFGIRGRHLALWRLSLVGYTMRELAERFGCSYQRIQQQYSEIVTWLRTKWKP